MFKIQVITHKEEQIKEGFDLMLKSSETDPVQ
jgi:hypothetical protein